MSQRRNGFLEVRFNDERSQVIANIYPPSPTGDAVTAADVLLRLKGLGVSYGIREQAILEAVHRVRDTHTEVVGLLAAQGILPQHGTDAVVHYRLPYELLVAPVPKLKEADSMPDWFALNPENFVMAGDEIANIIPSQPGTAGQTLTWPLQPIPAKPGKPSAIAAGNNVRASADGLRLIAAYDGYVCLHGEQLFIYAFQQVRGDVVNDVSKYPMGAAFFSNVVNSDITTGTFIAINGKVVGSHLRCQRDILLASAENCSIVAGGMVYVGGDLKNCEINTRNKVIMLNGGTIVGGTICATEGVEAAVLGAEDFTETDIQVGTDRYSEMRNREIEEELQTCMMNCERIGQAIKPFTTLAAHTALPDDRRFLLQKLQAQQQTLERRVKELHSERRKLTIAANEQVAAEIGVSDTVHPGVWLRIGRVETLVEQPQTAVRFSKEVRGKSVRVEPMKLAA